jgi:hypothetical protein
MTTETPPDGRAGLLGHKRRALVRGGSPRRPVCEMVSAPHGLAPRHRDAMPSSCRALLRPVRWRVIVPSARCAADRGEGQLGALGCAA